MEESKVFFKEFKDRESYAFYAAQHILEAARKAVRERGRFSLVLSGGASPISVYNTLSLKDFPMPWESVHLFFGDERAVAPDDDRSNLKMATQALLRRIDLPGENLHPMLIGPEGAEASAKAYEEEILDFFGEASGVIPHFDMVLLGMGGDGHTASIFPGSPALSETKRLVVATPVPEARPQVARVTMTLPLINAAREVVFLVAGGKKRDVVDEIVQGKAGAGKYPAAKVHPRGLTSWYFRA